MNRMGGKQLVNKVLVLLAIAAVAGAALGGLWLLPLGDAYASGHSASRSMPASVAPGGTVTVTISASNFGGLGKIVDNVPSEFTPSGSQTFGLLGESDSVSYTVTAPDSPGTYTFEGIIYDVDNDGRPIGGASSVTITAPTTPTPTPTVTPTPPAPSATASRSMPASVAPGGTVTVTISASNFGGLGKIVDNVPGEFTPSGSQTFGLLGESDSVSYTVTASDTAGTYSFSGTLYDVENRSYMVGGRSSIRVGQPTPTPTRRPSTPTPTPTPAPTPEPENRPPSFPSETATRSIAENQLAGSFIGAPVRATDPDNDVLIYGLLGPDEASFSVDAGTGQLRTKATLDYETKSTYMVTVAATDPDSDSDRIMVTIMVTNVNEMGMVELSSMTPMVGVDLTATLTDPDVVVEGSVAWQWTRSMSMDGTFENIDGATSGAYTPTADEVGYYLRATVMYADGHGSGKDAMETTTAAVVTTGDPLVARYDANGNGEIEKSEVIKAINDYLFGTGDGTLAPSKAEVIRLINLYLFG